MFPFDMQPNAFYVGDLKICLGRDPDNQASPELYPLYGCEGFAYEIPGGMYAFLIDGYFNIPEETTVDTMENYTYRVEKRNLRFF